MDSAVNIEILSDKPQFLGEELKGIELLNFAELNTYIATYIVLHDFPEVHSVSIRILINDTPIYQASVSRERAFAFPEGELDLSRSPDAQVLYASAVSARMIRNFNIRLLSEELQKAVNEPGVDDIRSEAEGWVSGADITDITLQNNDISISLDITDIVNLLFEPQERNSEMAQSEIETQAKMNTINTIGSLMDRFPSLQSVTVTTTLDNETYLTYFCSRELFNSISSEPFITAATLEEYNTILSNITPGR